MALIECIDRYLMIEREKDESTEKYYDRCNLIRKNLLKKKYSIDELITLSKIYVNNKYLKSIYSDEIMAKIKELN